MCLQGAICNQLLQSAFMHSQGMAGGQNPSWTPRNDNELPVQHKLKPGPQGRLMIADNQRNPVQYLESDLVKKQSGCTLQTESNLDVGAVSADLPTGKARRYAPVLMEHIRQCDLILMIEDNYFDTNNNHRPENELNLTALAAFASFIEQGIAALPEATSASWTEWMEESEGDADKAEL